jgi:ERI1 exoribonuclease 3
MKDSLKIILRKFDSYFSGLLKPDIRFSFITCGDWDLGEMLPQQAKHFKLFLPAYFNNWINAKHAFSEVIGHYPRSLMLMLESLGIEQTGRAHSGIDDCKNIVQVVQNLAKRGHIFRTSGETKNLKTVKFVRR